MGRVRLALVSLVLVLASGTALASDPVYWGTYNDGSRWQTYVGRGDAGTVTANYRGSLGNQRFVVTPGGLGKYNYVPRSYGITASRSVSLPIKASATSGLKTAVQVAVQDTMTIAPEVLATAGRVMVRNVLPVVGAGILAYDVYHMLTDHDITYDQPSDSLVINVTDEIPSSEFTYKVVSSSASPYGFGANAFNCSVGNLVADIAGCFGTYSTVSGGTTYTFTRGSLITNQCPAAAVGSNCSVSYHYTIGRYPLTATTGDVSGVFKKQAVQCPSGYIFNNTIPACVKDYSRPATDEEIESAISSSPATDLVKLPPELAAHGYELPLPLDAPASYTASPTSVTTPETTSTTTTHNPDGSTSSQTRHDQQTVTVEPQGDNVSNNRILTTVTNNYYITNNEGDTIEEHNENPPPVPDSGADPNPEQPDACADGACAFDAPELPSAKTFTESLIDLYASMSAAPIAGALSGVAALFPSGGECPTAEFDALEHHFVIDSQCALMDMYRGSIQSIMLFFYFLGGLVLFFKA